MKYLEFLVNFHLGLRTEGSSRVFKDGECSIVQDCYLDEVGDIYSRRFKRLVESFNSPIKTIIPYSKLGKIFIHFSDGSLKSIDGELVTTGLSNSRFSFIEYNDIIFMVNGEDSKQLNENGKLYNIGISAPNPDNSDFASEVSSPKEIQKCESSATDVWGEGGGAACELQHSLYVSLTEDTCETNPYDSGDTVGHKITLQNGDWDPTVCDLGDIWYQFDKEVDLSKYDKIRLWIYVSEAYKAGEIKLFFSDEETEGSSLNNVYISLPAIPATTGTIVELDIPDIELSKKLPGVGFRFLKPTTGSDIVIKIDNIYATVDGNLTGTYYYKYTYIDSNGRESLASNTSNAVTVSSGSISIDLKRSQEPSVVSINIYRLGGTLTDWYLVDTLDNKNQTYTDKTDDTDLSVLFDADSNDTPPNGLMYLVEHYERAVGAYSDDYPNSIQYSVEYQPSYWGSNLSQQYTIGDSRKCSGLLGWDRYIVFYKSNSIYVVEGYNPANWHIRKSASRVGNIAPNAIDFYRIPIFLSYLGLYLFDGDKETYIADRIKSFFEDNRSYLHKSICCIYDNKYFLSIPGASKVLVYDFLLNIFYVYNLKITEIVYNELDGKLYAGDSNNNLVNLNSEGNINLYDTFNMRIKSKAYPLNEKFNESGYLKDFIIGINTKNQDVTMRVYIDGALRQSIDLNTSSMEKVFKKFNATLKGRFAEFEFVCENGTKQIKIEPPLIINPKGM